jgi:hypothetical protein
MDWRRKAAYKAESYGKAAAYVKTLESEDSANAAVAL